MTGARNLVDLWMRRSAFKKEVSISAVLTALLCNAGAAQVGTTTAPLSDIVERTEAQRKWLEATPEQRVTFSERLGENGARAMAKAKGYKVLFDGTRRSISQGPDQVYRTVDGRVIVYEAKGGSGQLGHAYGHPQGSTEWAVESSKRVLHHAKSAAAEKAATKAVLEAASHRKLEVHVIRTKHVLGEPGVAVLEQTATTTDAARRIARAELKDAGIVKHKIVRRAVANSKDVSRLSGTAKAARSASKALVVVGVVVDAGYRANDVRVTEERFSSGEITQEEREVEHAKNAAGMVGGWGGAVAGAKLGAIGGGAGGTMVAPGPGTAVGAALGGAAGGVAGYFGGEAAAEMAAEKTVRAVHSAGTTVADAATSAWSWTTDTAEGGVNTANRAWNWVWGD